MNRAQEILQEYVDRRKDGTTAADPSLQDENLRRLLRRVAAAHPPSESLEGRLLPAMLRAAEENRTRPRRRVWPRLAAPAWPIWAPVAALIVVTAIVAWRSRPSPVPAPPRVVGVPPQPAPLPDQAPFPGPPPSPFSPIGSVLISEGELLRQQAREKRWEPIEGGEKVYPGDTLRTGAGPGAIIFFDDGSYSELKAKTTLRFARTTDKELQRPERLDLERGTVVCVVQKGGPRFVVETPSGAKAVVHGTTFTVTVGPKRQTLLLVEEGVVALKSQGRQVLVQEGMQTQAAAGQAPRRPVPLTAPFAPPPPESSPEGTLRVAPPVRRPDAAGGSHGDPVPDGAPSSPAPSSPPGTSAPGDAPAERARLPATSSSYTPEDRVQIPFSTSR